MHVHTQKMFQSLNGRHMYSRLSHFINIMRCLFIWRAPAAIKPLFCGLYTGCDQQTESVTV